MPASRSLALLIAAAVRKAAEHVLWLGDIDWDEDLGGACAAASQALHRLLLEYGFNSLFIEGEFDIDGFKDPSDEFIGHCWVLVGYKNSKPELIDVTATQFGEWFPPIHIPKGDELNIYRAEPDLTWSMYAENQEGSSRIRRYARELLVLAAIGRIRSADKLFTLLSEERDAP